MGSELDWLKKIVESGKTTKLAPGVIGKSTMMWLPVVLGWVAVIARLSETTPVINAEMLGAILVATIFVARETGKMRDYAAKNPGPALLEGAEFTEYKRFEAQAKMLPDGDKSPPGEASPHQNAVVATDKSAQP